MKASIRKCLPLAAMAWMLVAGTLHAASTNVAYTDSAASDVVRYLDYDGSWSGESTGPDTNDTGALKWHAAATSPSGTEQAVVAMGFGAFPKHIDVSLYAHFRERGCVAALSFRKVHR